jgi:hypothetical protein
VEQIVEMTPEKQNEIRTIIRDAAHNILNQKENAPKGTHDMAERESECDFRETCHFFNLKTLTPGNSQLKKIYCIQGPKKCAIYQAKASGRTVLITLWPSGELKV